MVKFNFLIVMEFSLLILSMSLPKIIWVARGIVKASNEMGGKIFYPFILVLPGDTNGCVVQRCKIH